VPGGSGKRLSRLAGLAALVGAAGAPGIAMAQSALPPYGGSAVTATTPLPIYGDGTQANVSGAPLRGATSDGPAAPVPTIGTAESPINYGRPRPKKSVLYKPDPRGSRPLPPLAPYATAQGTRKRGGPAADQGAVVAPAPTVAAVPIIERRARPKVDDAPFAPTGVDAGSLRLTPFVETGLGYDTNPNRQSASVRASPFAEVNAGVGVQSQWSQHSLTADLRGGYDDYFRLHAADHPNGAGKIDARIDVLRDTQVDLEGRFLLATQTPGSPQIAVPGSTFITNRPSVLSYGGSAGVTQHVNRLTLSLRGNVDRTQSQDGVLSDGTTLRLSTTDFTDYGLTARAGYELTPGLVPFVDLTADTRKHDQSIDLYGFARDSTGIQGRAGSTFEITRILTGDIALGYADRHYVDARLPNLSGPTVDGSLTYALTPLTTVSLRASTSLAETTQANASGAISRSINLQVSHALFRNFTLTGIATYTNNDYRGQPIQENLYSGSWKAEYSVSRDIVLKGSYTHERLSSSLTGSSYSADVFLAGVRLQR
jgi:hypothetical protein